MKYSEYYNLILADTTLTLIADYRAPSASVSSTMKLVQMLSDPCSCETQCHVLGDFKFPNVDKPKTYSSTASTASECFVDMYPSCNVHQNIVTSARHDHLLDRVLSSFL